MENKYTIAVFYENENLDAAQKMCSMLQDADIKVILTDDTTADDMSKEQFSLFVKDVYAFVFLLTPKSLEHTFLEEEIDFAIQNERIIIPVMLENFELNGAVAHQLANVQRVSAYEFNTGDALAIVANQLKIRIESERTASYSIFKFFAKKFGFELGKLWERISLKIKAYIASRPRHKLIITPVSLVTMIATASFIYRAGSNSIGWSIDEVYFMTFVSLLPGFLLMQLAKLISGKSKNIVIIAVIAIITAVITVYAMMFTGAVIYWYNQR